MGTVAGGMTDLEEWLRARGLERYAAAFEAAEVDLETLPHLTDEDLKEIGLPLGPRRRILAAGGATGASPPAVGPEPSPASSPERRQITVMFVDLVGSTRLSVEVDPEVLADLLKQYKDLVTQEIVAAGGHVAKYLGDGALAFFGWPHAREDAAECSVRCGFEVIDQVRHIRGPDGAPLECRIGIATGLVVVGGEAGEGTAREDAIAGEAPNLAARLQALASPGSMVISERTHRQLGQLFECEYLGEQAVNGFIAPVRAWRPLHRSANISRFAARAVRTSFVGRESELALLTDRWHTACEGTGRSVLILAEAGMGKSRLAEALHDRILDRPHNFARWQCSPYHQTKALYPVVECLMGAAGIVDADPPTTQLAKLAALIGATQMPPETALPVFAQLLAVPPEAGYGPPALTPTQLREATIAAVSAWVRDVAGSKPLLFLVEDAHWIDATTLEVLTRLVGASGDVPLLTVITGRPEFASPWSGRSDVSLIGLDRLNSRDCEGLVREIAGAVGAETAIVQEIVSRSDGNPLFVEELSAAVFETRAAEGRGAVPDSLQSSLMARLDQLGAAKETAQVCSVLGRRFARPLLTHVTALTPDLLDVNLSLLVEHDIIRPIGGAADGRYEFKHALVCDAAYESLLLSQRRQLHQACGLHLEGSFPEVARTEPELLAHHFDLAGLARQAGDYAEQAGDRATAACASVEAIASYKDALRQGELLPGGPDRDARTLALLLKLGPAIGIVNGAQDPELGDVYRRAEALSRTAADRDALFKAVWGLWYNAIAARELDDAAAFAQQLVLISEQSDDEDHRLEALHCRWSSELFRGDYTKAGEDARRGTELYDRDRHHGLGLIFGGHDPGVCAFGVRGQAMAFAGDLEGACGFVDAAVALGEALEHPSSLAHGLITGLVVGTVARAPEVLRPYAERMLELGRKFNAPPQQAMGAYHLAWADAEQGEGSRGLEQMGALYDRVTKLGPIILLYKAMYVGQLLKAGRAEEALAVADRAVADLRYPDMGLCLSELFRVRGECLAALGRVDEAIPELVRAEAMAKRDGAGLLQLRAAVSLHRAESSPRSTEAVKAAFAVLPPDRTGPDFIEARAILAG